MNYFQVTIILKASNKVFLGESHEATEINPSDSITRKKHEGTKVKLGSIDLSGSTDPIE